MPEYPNFSWDESSTREAVDGRSNGVCEGCGCRRATDMHHRKSRGVGGKWSPANILHLCRGCHRWVTDHPAESYSRGLMVRSTDDPQEAPVQRLTGDMLFLSDDVAPPLRKGSRR